MGFSIFRGVMTALFCLLLLFLFLVPSQYLVRVSDRAQESIDRAKAAILAGDPAGAAAPCGTLLALYDEHALALERFLNHEAVDAFGSALAIANASLSVGDADAAYTALTEAEALLTRIRGIELFSPNSLL